MSHPRGEPSDDAVASSTRQPSAVPDRPLPPPPTFGELIEVFRRRLRLRYPEWDATRLILVLAAVIGLSGMAWAVLHRPVDEGASGRRRVGSEPIAEVSPLVSTTTTEPSGTVAAVIVVDVAGAVARPGPIRIGGGARVEDAIHAAGGPVGEADLERVDRAARLHDGERIYVPRRGQTEVPQVLGPTATGSPGGATDGSATDAATGGVVDLNTADATALETLPGVGPSTAQAILDHRREQGRFASVEDLLDVKGIGPAKFAAIKPHVTV